MSGVVLNHESIVPDVQVPVADESDSVAVQQLANGRAGQGAKFTLPVVIAHESRIAHFLRIEFAGVAHQLVDLARAKTRETAFQIRQVELAACFHAEKASCPRVSAATIDRPEHLDYRATKERTVRRTASESRRGKTNVLDVMMLGKHLYHRKQRRQHVHVLVRIEKFH